MRGWRFYQEVEGKGTRHLRRKASCVAVDLGTGRAEAYETTVGGKLVVRSRYVYDGVGGVTTGNNPPVAGTGISRDYLEQECVRVSGDDARVIHPALFRWLDQDESGAGA